MAEKQVIHNWYTRNTDFALAFIQPIIFAINLNYKKFFQTLEKLPKANSNNKDVYLT